MRTLTRWQRALRHPDEIWPALVCALRRRAVREVEHHGERFYAYRGELYPAYLHEGNAAAFIRDTALKYCQGQGIDVGANEWCFPGAEPIDDSPDENALKLGRFQDESLDFVFSSHCLEHIAQWKQALDLWIQKLKPGGVLFLYLPHESMLLWRPGGPWVGGAHKWSPTRDAITPHLASRGLDIIEASPGRDAYWSFHICARKPESAADA
jgi:SAM-dependent methyltransferase